jgi:anti-sigma factor RsiW
MKTGGRGEDHLTESVIAAYLDRRMGAEERRVVDSHLAGCDECRTEVVDVSRLVSQRKRPWLVAAAGLGVAAAAVLVIALAPRGVAPGGPVLRNGAEGPAAIAAVAPADSGLVAADSARFVWRSAGADATYRLTVTDVRGDPVWSATMGDTAVAVTAGLMPMTSYYWYVDALLPDGRSVTTGVRTFRTGP